MRFTSARASRLFLKIRISVLMPLIGPCRPARPLHRRLFERLNFPRGEWPKFAGRHAIERERAKSGAGDFAHFVANFSEHAAKLKITPFAQADFQNALARRA